MANPDAADRYPRQKEPLLKKDIEKRRLIYVYKDADGHARGAQHRNGATSAYARIERILRHDQGGIRTAAHAKLETCSAARFCRPRRPDDAGDVQQTLENPPITRLRLRG